MTDNPKSVNQVYNAAPNGRTSLTQLYGILRALLVEQFPQIVSTYRNIRIFVRALCDIPRPIFPVLKNCRAVSLASELMRV